MTKLKKNILTGLLSFAMIAGAGVATAASIDASHRESITTNAEIIDLHTSCNHKNAKHAEIQSTRSTPGGMLITTVYYNWNGNEWESPSPSWEDVSSYLYCSCVRNTPPAQLADSTVLYYFDGTKFLRCGTDATSVSLNKSTATIDVNGTVSLTATVQPANAADKCVTWQTDNQEVATVVDGVVTGLNAGVATITATSYSGNFTATCTVTVHDHSFSYSAQNATITATCGADVCTLANKQISTTVQASANGVISLSDIGDFAAATGLVDGDFSITYKKSGSAYELLNAPTSPGSYTVAVSVSSVTATLNYDIHGADESVWAGDDQYHWYPCVVSSCTNTEHISIKTAHSQPNENGKCTTCDRILHTHEWGYALSADGESIIATCTGTVGTCYVPNATATLTLSADGKTYNGSTYDDASVDATEFNTATGKTITDENITYKNLAGAPTDAGTYTAQITVENVTAEVSFTIDKADLVASNFMCMTLPVTYDGTAKTAAASAVGLNGVGVITVSYVDCQNNTVESAINAGTYNVCVTVTEGTNYNAVTTNLQVGQLTINPYTLGNTNLSLDKESRYYTYTGSEITPVLTVKVGDTVLVKDTDYEIVAGSTTSVTNVGSGYTISINGIGNYSGQATITWTVMKANPSSTIFNITYPESLIYKEGEAKVFNVEIAEGVEGIGSITKLIYVGVSYDENGNEILSSYAEGIAPSEIGVYRIYIDVEGGDNYNSATELSVCEFEIVKPKNNFIMNLFALIAIKIVAILSLFYWVGKIFVD